MSNFQYTLSAKGVFGKLAKELKQSIIEAQNETKYEIERLLGTEYNEGGFSAYDYFRQYYYGKAKTKEHHYNLWTVRNRNGSLEVRNRASYAKALYTGEASSSHPTGYRSASPHKPMYFTTINGKKVLTYRKPSRKKYIEITRPNQITKARHTSIQNKILKIATKNISTAIGDIAKVKSTYKG